MPCLIELKDLITVGDAYDPYGNWKVTSTHSPSITVEHTDCGTNPVEIGTNPAAATDALLNGAGGVAYNDDSLNPNPGQNGPARTEICMSQVPDNTTFTVEYCITYPNCTPACTTISIFVQNGCQYLVSPSGTGSSCSNPIVITDPADDLEVDGPNGITGGVPWPNFSDCDPVLEDNTYPKQDGTTGNWVFNPATGVITTPDDIVCGHCERFDFESTPNYAPGNDCQPGICSSSASLSVKYEWCNQNAVNGFRYFDGIRRSGNQGPFGVTGFTVRRNGTLVNLGSFPSLFIWDPNAGNNGEYVAQLSVVNNIQTAIQNNLVDGTCYKACTTVYAFSAPPDGPQEVLHTLSIAVYFCNVCNLLPGTLTLDSEVIATSPQTCTGFVPGTPPPAYSGPTGDC